MDVKADGDVTVDDTVEADEDIATFSLNGDRSPSPISVKFFF